MESIKVKAENKMTNTNNLRTITRKDGITDAMVAGLDAGVYEMFECEDGSIDLIDTGLLSVNCQCLVIAPTQAEAQKMLDECDPAASGCNDTHLTYCKSNNDGGK